MEATTLRASGITAAANPANERTRTLLDELLGYPDVPDRWGALDLDLPPAPFLCVRYRRSDTTLSFFSTITTFGTPQDVTLQKLRIECLFPADDATRSSMLELAQSETAASGVRWRVP